MLGAAEHCLQRNVYVEASACDNLGFVVVDVVVVVVVVVSVVNVQEVL